MRVLIACSAAVLCGIVLSAPVDILVSRIMPDDVFYYFQTAKVFVSAGFSSFDGVNATNGYQPLWFLISTVAARLFGGGEPLIRVMLCLSLALTVVTFLHMWEFLARLVGGAVATAAISISLLFVRTMMNGLETALYMCLFVASAVSWHDLWAKRAEPLSVRARILVGTLFGLTFLARTDFALVLLPIGFSFLLSSFAKERTPSVALRRLLPLGAPLLLIVGGYLLSNVVAFGHLMPVSGAAKQYHSARQWEDAIDSVGYLRAYWQNASFLFVAPGYRFVLVALVLPFLNWGFALRVEVDHRQVRSIESTALLAVGLWLITGFYVGSFFGSFSQTIWYYGPHVVIAAVALAQSANLLARWLGGGRLTAVLIAAAISAWTLAWPAAGGIALWAVLAILFLLTAVSIRTPLALAGWVGAATTVIPILIAIRLGTPLVSLSGWTAMIVGASGLAVFGRAFAPRFDGVMASGVSTTILFATTVIHAANIRTEIIGPPGGWNYHLLLGAQWADKTLPADARIWSGSSGILGYFSNRQVINTDGLINSYEFLDRVLRPGKLGEYVSEFDYAIDAFPINAALQDRFPGGCYVPLPDIGQKPFPAADGVRQLRVYQMHSSGTTECQSHR